MTGAQAVQPGAAVARRGLRIALAFAAAFVVAEGLRSDLQLTFIAPLVAGMMASAAPAPVGMVLALPVIAWLLVAAAGYALLFLGGMPLVLCLLGLCVFRAGFGLLGQARKAPLGLLTLVIFGIIPQTLVKAPELSADLARWLALNVAIAAGCELVTRWLLPDPARPAPAQGAPQLPPLFAAAALLLGVMLTATLQLPAPGAVVIGIVIVLRADGESAVNVIRDRFLGALLGGAAAVAVWEVIWLAPDLSVLATATLCAAWVFASRIAAGGPMRGLHVKSLNVLAILLGEGFSIFYDDTEDRVWTRIAGVALGLGYAALVHVVARNWRTRRSRLQPATT
ncbi:MAG: FUSC family protein [Acetobacteraceae bacterium]|nr:FUSC family protein [Acetobacteraceae bacterium]